MTFVPAIRTLLDKRAEKKDNINKEAFSSSGESVLNKIASSSGIIPKRLKILAVGLLLAISGYGYFSFTNLETIFEFTDFLPEDDPVVQTLGLLTDEFGGGFGETTAVVIEGDNLAIVTLNDLSPLSEAKMIRSDFVSNVSHEIRSPLTSIIGFVETLQGPAGDDINKREKFLEIISKEASRMTNLVSDL